MHIRRVQEKDIKRLSCLLEQVCLVHYNGRPDLFRKGAKKYTESELATIIKDDLKPIFVATDEKDIVIGYAFCIFQQYRNDNILTDVKTLYIDDLCIDEKLRGNGIGKKLYETVLDFAKENGCYNVTLNVWSLNESAMNFYKACGLEQQKVSMEKII